MKQLLVLSVLTAVILGGCKEQPSETVVDNTANYSVIANGTEYLTAEQVEQFYQQPNSSGLIRLMRTESDICFWNNGVYGPYDFDDSHITDAIFWNNGIRANIGDHFELNARPIKQYADGTAYTNLGGGFEAPIYLGGGLNRFEFINNGLFGAFRDSLSFGSPIHITSLNRLDTVHSNQDLTLSWAGGVAVGKIKVSLTASRLVDNYVNNGETHGIQFYITPNANKTITIHKEMLQQLNTTHAIGKFYDISLTTAEPKIITTPNNKTISVLGVSRHEVTIVLKH
jgi:hypothetical protein